MLLLAAGGAAPLRVWMPELAAGAAPGAEQMTLMDLRSLSNSSVASLLYLHRRPQPAHTHISRHGSKLGMTVIQCAQLE